MLHGVTFGYSPEKRERAIPRKGAQSDTTRTHTHTHPHTHTHIQSTHTYTESTHAAHTHTHIHIHTLCLCLCRCLATSAPSTLLGQRVQTGGIVMSQEQGRYPDSPCATTLVHEVRKNAAISEAKVWAMPLFITDGFGTAPVQVGIPREFRW